MDLFAKKNGQAPKTSKSTDREVVELSGYENDLQKMLKLDEKIAALTAERKSIEAEIKEISKDKMIDLYNAKKSFPGTILVKENTMSFQFITMDKYISINEDSAKELKKKYGKTIVEENTVYSFNTQILEKNREVINNLIVNCPDIDDTDKALLIEQKTTWSIAKGTIKNLKNELFAKFDLETLISDIAPIFSIKSLKKES